MIGIHIGRLTILAVAVPLAAGCNGSAYPTAPVQGRVTVDDKPLFQGRVLFTPVAKGDDRKAGRTALGKIDSEGNYRLTTYAPNDGAIVGEHWAIVINSEEDLPKGVPEFARVTLPEMVRVEADKNNRIDLSFTRDEIKKYREDDR
jgi:hypothetical protein